MIRRVVHLVCCLLLPGCLSDGVHPTRLDATAPVAAQELYAEGSQLLIGEGRKVGLHGFNYFGFNNGQTMVDGLWGGNALASDFATVVQRQKALGFNAVRLPFSFHDLLELAPRSFAQPCTVPTLSDIARSVTPPGGQTPALTALAQPLARQAGQCNGYLPSNTVWNRFVWVVRFYAQNGFYVLIDNHLREDSTALQDAGRWAGLWAKLVGELAADPVIRPRLMVDLLNEPDQYGLRWERQGNKPGLAELYLRAMDAIYGTGARPLLFIEGTGQGALQANWGDGFDTDAADVTGLGLSDPRPFFRALQAKPYRRQVVLAPHVYGPAVTTNPRASSGAALSDRLSRSFGMLSKRGFCDGSKCSSFPVAIGEFGSKMERADDVATMRSLVDYLNVKNGGSDGKHVAIANWFWWSWNPNSGDTGGLVQDDWLTIQWQKIQLLRSLGL